MNHWIFFQFADLYLLAQLRKHNLKNVPSERNLTAVLLPSFQIYSQEERHGKSKNLAN